MTEKILVPDIGEASDVEVIEILVALGDRVEADQSLVVLESDKASMEIPAPVAGVVASIQISLGDGVQEGDLLLELSSEGTVDALPESAAVEAAVGDVEQTQEPKAAEVEPDRSHTEEEVVSVAVPDIGEAEEVEVTELLVNIGDHVEVEQSLLVLESDKASMEIPSTQAGEVLDILVKTGDTVNEGDALMLIRTTGGSAESMPVASETQLQTATPEPVSAGLLPQTKPVQVSRTESSRPTEVGASVHAGPAVRKEARELGVNLSAVKGSGRGGRILKEDVQGYVKTRLSGQPEAHSSSIPVIPPVDFSRFGGVEEMAFSRVRKASARNLHRSWLNVPHVTQFDQADITDMEAFRKQQNQQLAAGGVKLTPLAFLVMAVVKTLQAFPRFNSSLMPEAEGLILKHYYHIGIAVDTDDGLVVPVIRHADQMSLAEIAQACGQLADDARSQRLKMDAMQGACFTISSLGGIGGTAFTPIVNAPEVAILGVSRSEMKPVYNGSEFQPRLMLPLSLSYDHRAIDGAEAARFTSHLVALLSDIRRLLI